MYYKGYKDDSEYTIFGVTPYSPYFIGCLVRDVALVRGTYYSTKALLPHVFVLKYRGLGDDMWNLVHYIYMSDDYDAMNSEVI